MGSRHSAGVHLEQVNVSLEQLGQLYGIFDFYAVGKWLGAAHAKLDKEILAALLLDAVKNHNRETCPVFHTTAVLVGPFIKGRGKDSTVSHVYQHHVIAEVLHRRGMKGIAIGNFIHDILGHFLGWLAIPANQSGADIIPLFLGESVYFHRCLGAVEMNDFG